MDTTIRQATARRRHLLTAEQLAVHADATAHDLASGVRHGNGIRIHRTYIFAVSLATLVILLLAIVIVSATT